jgi:hypothetical protein
MHLDEVAKDVRERARRGTTTRQDVEDVCEAVAKLREEVRELADRLGAAEEVGDQALDMIIDLTNMLRRVLRRVLAGKRLTRKQIFHAVAFSWDAAAYVRRERQFRRS